MIPRDGYGSGNVLDNGDGYGDGHWRASVYVDGDGYGFGSGDPNGNGHGLGIPCRYDGALAQSRFGYGTRFNGDGICDPENNDANVVLLPALLPAE